MKKRFVSILLVLAVATMWGVPFAFAGEEQVTPREGSIEAAQEEVFVLLEQLMEGEKEKGAVLVEFGNLVKRWGERGVGPEILISSWNSYVVLFARIALESYQAALWDSEGGSDEEIFRGYSSFLERLGFSSKLLELHGRGTKSFDKASKVFEFLKARRDFILAIGGKESEEGFDLSEVKYFELSDEELDQWDLYLGKHELPSGEEMPNQMYRAKLLSAWEGHHKAVQSYVKSVESRGFWEMLQGALRGDLEDPNQMEIEGATRLLGQYRMQMVRLGVSVELIQEMLKKEKGAHKYAGLLFDEDISEVKWATVGVVMAPLIPVSMSVGVALGLSVKASAVMAGIPMLIMGVKGAGSFVIQGLFDKGHFSGAKFYNDMMPGLTSALPFSAVLPLCAGGITAIAATEAASTTMIANTGISAGEALAAGSFYILIGYGVIRGGASAGEGILELARRDAERGTLLIWDGTVDIAASLLFLKFAGPKASGRSENDGGSSGDSSSSSSPSPEVGGGGKYFPERAEAHLPAREGNIFLRAQNSGVGGNQPKGDSQATTVALLEEPATLRDLLEIPETLPPDDILLGQTSPQSRFGALPQVYPVWTGNPLVDDGKEDVIIVEEDEKGNRTFTRVVRVDKGSSEEEIWRQVGGRRGNAKILGARPSNVSPPPHGISPQGSKGQPMEVIRDGKLTDNFRAFAARTAKLVYNQSRHSPIKHLFSEADLLSDFYQRLAMLIDRERESINHKYPALYFIQTMRNLCIDLIRKEIIDRQHERKLEERAVEENERRRLRDASSSALDGLIAEEDERIAKDLLEFLEREDDRTILNLARQGLSYHEMASQLGITHSLVKSRLHWARERMKAILEEKGAISDIHGAASDKAWILILLTGSDEEWPKIIPAMQARGCGADEATMDRLLYLAQANSLTPEVFKNLGFNWDDSDLIPLRHLEMTQDLRQRIAKVIRSLPFLADGVLDLGDETEIWVEEEEPSFMIEHANRFEAVLWLYGTRGIFLEADDENDRALREALINIIILNESSRHDRLIALNYYIWIFGTFPWDGQVGNYLAHQADSVMLRGVLAALYDSKTFEIPHEVIERLKHVGEELLNQKDIRLFYIHAILSRHGERELFAGYDILRVSRHYLLQASYLSPDLPFILLEAVYGFLDSEAEIVLSNISKNMKRPQAIRERAERLANEIWFLHEKIAKILIQHEIVDFYSNKSGNFFRDKLDDEDPQVVNRAKEALKRIGNGVVPFLYSLWSDPDFWKKDEIRKLIGDILGASDHGPSRPDADGAASDKAWILILLTGSDQEWPKIIDAMKHPDPTVGADEETGVKLVYLFLKGNRKEREARLLGEIAFEALKLDWWNDPDVKPLHNLEITKDLQKRVVTVLGALSLFTGVVGSNPKEPEPGTITGEKVNPESLFSIAPPDGELFLRPRLLPPFQGGSSDGGLAAEKFQKEMKKIGIEIEAKKWLSEKGYRVGSYKELMNALVEVALKSRTEQNDEKPYDQAWNDRTLAFYYYIWICKTFPESVWDERLKKEVAQAEDPRLIYILYAFYNSGTIGLFHDEAVLNRLKRFGEKLFDDGDIEGLFPLYVVLARNGVGDLSPGHDILKEAMKHLFRRGDVADTSDRFVLLEAVRTFRNSEAEMILRKVSQNEIEDPAVRERAKIFLDEIWNLHEEMAADVLPEELALARQGKFTSEECVITLFFKKRLKHSDPNVRKRAEEVLKRVAMKETVPGMPSPKEAVIVLLQSLMDDASPERRGEIKSLIDEILRAPRSE